MADLTVLKDAGMDIDSMSEEERAALERLDPSELQTLATIRGKLNAEPEVAGYGAPVRADGGFVW